MPSGIKPTEEMIQKIKDLTEAGIARSKIAKEIGYSVRTIARYQESMGYRPNTRAPYDRCAKQDGISRMSIRYHGYGTKMDYEIDTRDKTLEIKTTGSKSLRFSLSLLGHLLQELEEISEELSNLF